MQACCILNISIEVPLCLRNIFHKLAPKKRSIAPTSVVFKVLAFFNQVFKVITRQINETLNEMILPIFTVSESLSFGVVDDGSALTLQVFTGKLRTITLQHPLVTSRMVFFALLSYASFEFLRDNYIIHCKIQMLTTI